MSNIDVALPWHTDAVRTAVGTLALVLGVLARTGGQAGDIPPVTCTIASDKAVPISVAPGREVYCGLDLGSNNVKLITLSVDRHRLATARDERQCRARLGLGAQAFDQATMTATPVAPLHVSRLVTVIKEMQSLCQRDGGRVVGADATQWARDATNIADIRAEVKRATGVDIDVLSPAKEGQFGYVSATRLQPGKVVVDPGSNSFQIAFWIKGAKDIESVSVPFGYVRAAAAAFANPAVADYAAARAQYVERVRTDVERALGQLSPPRSLAILTRAVADKSLDGDLVTMGQDGAIHLAVDGVVRPGGAWVTTQADYDARLKPIKAQPDAAYGEISARFPASRVAGYLGGLTAADFLALRTSPIREMYGERTLVVPVLVDWLARELGLATIVVVPAEMPNGFVLARAGGA